MRNYLSKLIILTLILAITISVAAPVQANEFFTMEMGTVLGFGITVSHSNNFNPLQVTQLGYGRRKGDVYLHIFGGSLEDDKYQEKLVEGEEYQGRNSYAFAEIGYQHDFNDSPYFGRTSIGLGRVAKVSKYLSSRNMFTFAASFGYRRYYISWRHISNGETILENPAPNKGRDMLTLGIEF
ncbi:hypothetical protein [Fuchsiella alkaliacetigena]|uniref:hypothetical protein n=1 Tax=Fuchsiella alkaliacetigena TaxID=957042 RepID=UPI00200A7671|nr:hypothetical protein [Fuchsiella alkaliacetigena]MCK8826116.1 hypothetical protein [Fuchsiella alkaliacetigena]